MAVKPPAGLARGVFVPMWDRTRLFFDYDQAVETSLT